MSDRPCVSLRRLPGLLALAITLALAVPAAATAQQAPPHPHFQATFAATAPATSTQRTDASQTPPERLHREDARPLSLDALLQQALTDNPEIQAAAARVAAAGQRPVQAASLPDPTLGAVIRNVGFTRLSLGDEMMSVYGLRFTQALPAGGKRPQRRIVAERGIDVARAQLEATRRRVLREIATAYYDLEFVHESIAVVEETRDLLDDLEQTAEARYAVGEGIQQDVLKAQVELSILLNRLVQLEQQRDTLAARINRLLGRDARTPLGQPAGVQLPPLDALDLVALRDEALHSSAVLRERITRIVQQEATVELARRDRRPDFVVSGAWLNRGSLPDIWELNVGVTLPIRKSQRQDRAIEENLEELNARRQDRSAAAVAVDEVIQDAFLQLDRAQRLVALFGDAIIPQATLSLESAMAGYGVGKVDFLTVLDNVITLLTYRLELEGEKVNAMKALARIEEHLGRSLGATPAGVWQSAPPATPSSTPAGRTAAGPAVPVANTGGGPLSTSIPSATRAQGTPAGGTR